MWGASAPELCIVGDGELKAELVKLAATDPAVPVRFLGQLEGAAAQAEIARARLLVLPSQCFEGFPMVIKEAFAFGTPVAVSDLGPLPAIVCEGKNGVAFTAGDPQSLLEAVQAVWATNGALEDMGAAARGSFEELYTENVNYRLLMEIYQQAADVNRRRRLL